MRTLVFLLQKFQSITFPSDTCLPFYHISTNPNQSLFPLTHVYTCIPFALIPGNHISHWLMPNFVLILQKFESNTFPIDTYLPLYSYYKDFCQSLFHWLMPTLVFLLQKFLSITFPTGSCLPMYHICTNPSQSYFPLTHDYHIIPFVPISLNLISHWLMPTLVFLLQKCQSIIFPLIHAYTCIPFALIQVNQFSHWLITTPVFLLH